jgi:hypothetical protein
MKSHGCRNHYSVEVRAIQQIIETSRGRNLGIEAPHVAEPLLAGVADEFELAILGLPQVAN